MKYNYVCTYFQLPSMIDYFFKYITLTCRYSPKMLSESGGLVNSGHYADMEKVAIMAIHHRGKVCTLWKFE